MSESTHGNKQDELIAELNQWKPLSDPEEDLLTNLPQEMRREILGRLPIRSIMRCKCVCKTWRHLIEGGDFATSYTPKPGLAFADRHMGYAVFDEAYQPLFQFGFPPHDQYYFDSIVRSHRSVIDSANGLLLAWVRDLLFLCNPMTREYIKLPPPPGYRFTFGFGVSKLGGQYKILCGDKYGPSHVYTLEIGGLWRSIPAAATATTGLPILPGDDAASLNGNLHWLAYDIEQNLFVCCFDLETELFTSLSLPPRDGGYSSIMFSHRLCILEDRLCLCDVSDDFDIVILRMNSYGDTNSWGKLYTFHQLPGTLEFFLPLKVLANGDLLFAAGVGDELLIYSKNTGVIVPYGQCAYECYSNIAIYTPSLLSLKAMGIHNVQSLCFF